jgi:hypothetical protein
MLSAVPSVRPLASNHYREIPRRSETAAPNLMALTSASGISGYLGADAFMSYLERYFFEASDANVGYRRAARRMEVGV